jgi:hypothetical protein
MHFHERVSLESARDNVRQMLYNKEPVKFPMGASYISVIDLATAVSDVSQPVASTVFECVECDHSVQTRSEITCFVELQRAVLDIQQTDTVAQILGRLLSMRTNRQCSECSGEMLKNTYVEDAPQLLILHIPYTDVKISQKIKFAGKSLCLRGVVYYGNHHYTSRIIDEDRNVWFHDGISTGSSSQSHGSAAKVKSQYFNKCNQKKVALFVGVCTNINVFEGPKAV